MLGYHKILIAILFIAISSNSLLGQWSHDFTDDNLSDWSGDVDNFIVNDDEELQLAAPAAGESFITRVSTIDFDTISYSLYHRLDFAPSDNNKSTIYLGMDQEDATVASGYFLELGENGSDDALKVYYLDGGISDLIATGDLGSVANEPATIKIDIDIYPDGFWSIRTNYNGGEFTTVELEFVDDRWNFSQSAFFGLACKYSASRADKFFYDNISMSKFQRDETPPSLLSIEPFDDNSIRFVFDEPLDQSSALNLSNYSLDGGIGAPSSVVVSNSLMTEYIAEFDEDFDSSIEYTFTATNATDLNGNIATSQMLSFTFAGSPMLGDILLTEILFDPYSGGEDFIEIYNTSEKFLQLQGCIIENTSRDEAKVIFDKITISPMSYIAFTENVDFIVQEYKPMAGAIILNQDLPAFNNDSGNVTFSSPSGEVLDSFDYEEDFHFQLIDDTEGVSLEKIVLSSTVSNANNWHSASENVRWATPGYQNSNFSGRINTLDVFSLASESFSPDLDGNEDLMVLNYVLDKSGFVANINVHDAAGYKIRALAENQLLGREGIITWDGTDEEGNISDLGIYIIVGELFHSDGSTSYLKKTITLAGFID